MKKTIKITLKITAVLFGLLILIVVTNLLIKLDSQLKSKAAYNAVTHLLNYHIKCAKYPTTDDGLLTLQKENSCYSPSKKLKNLETKNGYGFELVYVSDGIKFTLTSKSLLGDTVLTEEIITPHPKNYSF